MRDIGSNGSKKIEYGGKDIAITKGRARRS